jgi:hypothetical protein
VNQYVLKGVEEVKGWELAQFIYDWLHRQGTDMDDLSAAEFLEKLEEDR